MLNVLINAYAVSPNWGSEPGMGWNWVSNLAKYCNLHVVTEGEWKDEIEEALKKHPYAGNLHFYYLPEPDRVRRMCWNQGDWRFYYYHRLWQKKALQLERTIIEDCRTQSAAIGEHKDIDVVHHLNMIGFREPGYEWMFGDLPIVWGPIGGYGNIPMAYLKDAGPLLKIKESVKGLLNDISFRCFKRVRKAMQRADVVVGAYKETYEAIRKVYREDAYLINETGAFIEEQVCCHKSDASEFKLLWVGKYDLRKQLSIALRVMELLKEKQNIHLYVVGTGYPKDVEYYSSIVISKGLSNVHLLGKVPNAETKEMMKDMDLMLFTSVQDATSTVVPEAISAGLPVICHNTRGFGDIVDDAIGRKVEIDNPENSAIKFAEIITTLESDREEVWRMSKACLERRQEISWEANAGKMVKLYSEAIKHFGKSQAYENFQYPHRI